jgi:hypothetical protein
MADPIERLYWDLVVIRGQAGASLVLLIFSSRRTTLNRINVSLAQVAEQLKALGTSAGVAAHQRPAASAPASSPPTAGTHR